jgi:hypothetical protein
MAVKTVLELLKVHGSVQSTTSTQHILTGQPTLGWHPCPFCGGLLCVQWSLTSVLGLTIYFGLKQRQHTMSELGEP